MKSRRFKGVLAVMLVIVLMLSLVPLETVTPAAMQDKAKKTIRRLRARRYQKYALRKRS